MRSTARAPVATLLLLPLALLAPAGCARPLLAPNEVRSPFDRYDAVRSQYAPQYVENEFGARVPNLQGRLTPKN